MTMPLAPLLIHIGFSVGMIVIAATIMFLTRNCVKTLLTAVVVILLLLFTATVILIPPCIVMSGDVSFENFTVDTLKFGIYVVSPHKKWQTMNLTLDKNCTISNFYKDFTFLSAFTPQ